MENSWSFGLHDKVLFALLALSFFLLLLLVCQLLVLFDQLLAFGLLGGLFLAVAVFHLLALLQNPLLF
jgi:hypothetical protein